jgi:hypothetical protein
LTTRTSKRAAELKVGDAPIVLGEPRVIASLEENALGMIATLHGAMSFVFAHDAEVEVEEATPGRYDGYMSEVEGGWQVASAGADLGTYADESVAATVLAKTTKRPRWKVHADGRTIRLG